MCLIGWTYFYLMIMPCFIFILHVPWISPLSRGEISYDRLVRGSLRRSLTPTTPLNCIQPSLHNQTMVEKWRSILPEKKSWKWSSRSDHTLFVLLESPNWRFLLSYSYYVDSILRKKNRYYLNKMVPTIQAYFNPSWFPITKINLNHYAII